MVSLLHLAAVFLLTVGIGRPSANATRYKQSRLSVTILRETDQARYTQSRTSVNHVYDRKARRYAENNRT